VGKEKNTKAVGKMGNMAARSKTKIEEKMAK